MAWAWRQADQQPDAADDSTNDDKDHGLDFTIDPSRGTLAIGEASKTWDLGANAGKLPGTVKIGGYYDSGPRPDLRTGVGSKGDNDGLYAYLDQMVWREPGSDPDSPQGLHPWMTLTWADRQSVSQVPIVFGSGMIYTGLIEGRDEDKAAIGFLYGKVTNAYPDTTSEKVLEINYLVQVTPWFTITPDVQFIFQPSGDQHISDAVVVGGEIGITF